jgi:hypothetical protein
MLQAEWVQHLVLERAVINETPLFFYISSIALPILATAYGKVLIMTKQEET